MSNHRAKRTRGTQKRIPRGGGDYDSSVPYVREVEPADWRYLGEAYETEQYWRDSNVPDPLFLYFITENIEGPIKIGQAKDPRARLRTLQCGNPRPLFISAVQIITPDIERKVHEHWNHARIRFDGEWFGKGYEAAILSIAEGIAKMQIDHHCDGFPIDWIMGLPADFAALSRDAQEYEAA